MEVEDNYTFYTYHESISSHDDEGSRRGLALDPLTVLGLNFQSTHFIMMKYSYHALVCVDIAPKIGPVLVMRSILDETK